MGLLDSILNRIVSAVTDFLGPLKQVIDSFKNSIDRVIGIWDAAAKLRDTVLEEIDGWKNFKQDIRLKQRVINLETAIEKTRDLIEGIPESWHAIVDIIKQVKANFESSNVAGEAEETAAELTQGFDESGLKAILEKFPKLGRAAEKFLGVLAIILTALEQVRNVIDDLQSIVDELRRIRLEIEKLDTIFLSQSNKRKVVKLADGTTMKIRLGKLHS